MISSLLLTLARHMTLFLSLFFKEEGGGRIGRRRRGGEEEEEEEEEEKDLCLLDNSEHSFQPQLAGDHQHAPPPSLCSSSTRSWGRVGTALGS